ncbi:MAG: hypothetical protein ACYC6L_13495 [Anaerolineae bacterium]
MVKFNSLSRSPRLCLVNRYLPVFVFLTIAITLLLVNAFPSLYGDEYGSLYESTHLLRNLHAIGYLSQLYIWKWISQTDIFLRLLSLCWFAAGLYFISQWLKLEDIPQQTRSLVLWLALLNPFLWIYGLQIRFYAMFFSTSVLFLWRFRFWLNHKAFKSTLTLILSSILLLTSHLFGILVILSVIFFYLWQILGKNRWSLVILLVISTFVVFYPFTRLLLIQFVYRMTSNPVPNSVLSRGLGVGMLAKVPLSFYFFTVGERVYPLWWWVTIPGMLVVIGASFMGLWRLRRSPMLRSLIVILFLNVPLMFMVLDPLAPPGLQGAAPRYLIYVVPYFLLLLALGAQAWKPLKYLLAMVSLVGLFYLAFPTWSYGGSDLNDWQKYLKSAISQPDQTCIITDGRAQEPVSRYAPAGSKLALMGKLEDCSGYSRIILVSSDYRLSQVRYMDQMAQTLGDEYSLVSNVTQFPAQLTVYDKKASKLIQLTPSRLDLPEQDLHFPITTSSFDWRIDGFTRLDAQTSVITMPLTVESRSNQWLLTNYRTPGSLPAGTPVFKLSFLGPTGQELNALVVRTGEGTSAWDGSCTACTSVYTWTKLLQLLGSYAYPGAYRQYQAHIWAAQLQPMSMGQPTSVTITYLPVNGTGYFYGVYSDVR